MVAIGQPGGASVEVLLPQAAAIGEAWARECADDLRAQKRGVVGAWPGTIREARSRVLLGVVRLAAARSSSSGAAPAKSGGALPALPVGGATAPRTNSLDTETLQLLARTAYDAARRSWHVISEPDLEP